MQCTHTHTHARDTVRCAPLELLSILFPPLPVLHLLFHSIFVLYPNSSNRRTLDGTPNKCLNIYFYINRNNFWVFLFVIRFSLSYLLFTFFYACVFRSFVDWVFTFAQRVCSVSLRSLFLARSLSIVFYWFAKIYCQTHAHTNGILLFFTLRFGPTTNWFVTRFAFR